MWLQVYLVDLHGNNIILNNVLKVQDTFEIIGNKSIRYILITYRNGNTVKKYDDYYKLLNVYNKYD